MKTDTELSIRPVVGNSRYLVDTTGRFYRTFKACKRPVVLDKPEPKATFLVGGRPHICLTSDGGRKRRHLAALMVLRSFSFNKPSPRSKIVYADGDDGNIALSNLSWSFSESTTIDGELWADVGWARGFQASTLGRVRQFTESGWMSIEATRPRGERYKTVSINGRHMRLHSLIAEVFHGPRPDGLEVAHENGNEDDNRPDNLSYKTVLENARDRVRHGTQHRGEKTPTAKLTADQVVAIRNDQRPYPKISAAFGVCVAQVCRIKAGSRWAHIK